MNLADLMNDLAERAMEPDRLPDAQAVRLRGDVLRARVRRRVALAVATSAAAAPAVVALTITQIRDTAPEPVTPPTRPPGRVAVHDAGGKVSYVATDGSRQTLHVRNVDRFAVSPDGTTIAYITVHEGARGRQLWVTTDGGATREQVPAPCADCQIGYGVTWSHDGTRLAYVAWAAHRPQLRIRTVDTGAETVYRMPDGMEPRGPKFSPDDSRLVVNVDSAEGQYVATLDLARGVESLTRLTGAYSQVQVPNWSEDGSIIYFTATTAGNDTNDVHASIDLFAVDADGGHLRQITHARDGERYYGVTPYRDQFLIGHTVGDGPWTIGWLSADGATFTPAQGPDGEPLVGQQPQLER